MVAATTKPTGTRKRIARSYGWPRRFRCALDRCRLDLYPVRCLVVTWAPGGNLPPMLAAALLLRRHGHGVEVLGSGVTSVAAAHAGLRVRRYARAHDPDTKTAFERQAAAMMAAAAGPAIAFDVRDAIREYRPDLVV